jgi:hypothetical protein
MLQVHLSGCYICCGGYTYMFQVFVPNVLCASDLCYRKCFHVASVSWACAGTSVWDICCKYTVQYKCQCVGGEIKTLPRGVMYMISSSARTAQIYTCMHTWWLQAMVSMQAGGNGAQVFDVCWDERKLVCLWLVRRRDGTEATTVFKGIYRDKKKIDYHSYVP